MSDVTLIELIVPAPVAVVEVVTGLQGPPGRDGTSGNNLYLQFTQTAPQTTWLISHNFGRNPTVTLTTMTGEEILASISFPDLNTVQVDFTLAESGRAHLIA